MTLPTPRLLPSGSWRIQTTIEGKRVSITATTKKECQEHFIAIKAGKEKLHGNNPTLYDGIDGYINSRRNILSPSTIKGYKEIQRMRFKAYMHVRLSKLPLQSMINEECINVSPKTVKNAYGLVKAVLTFYGFDVPKVLLPKVQKKEKEFLDPEQLKRFIRAIEGNVYEYQILLACHGLRRSEALSHYTYVQNGYIHIEGSVVRNENGELIHKTTNKTIQSRRTVPVMVQRLSILACNGTMVEICPNSPERIRRAINAVCRQNNLPAVGWHGLRHSYASLMYYLGISVKEACKLGGWSNINTMMEIYTHLSELENRTAENKLISFFA